MDEEPNIWKKLKKKLNIKNVFIGIGFALIAKWFIHKKMSHTNYSMFDYEGFTVFNTPSLFLGLSFLFVSLIYKNKKLKSITSIWTGLMFLIFILMTLPLLNQDLNKRIKNMLPLTKISTTQISGTIAFKATISLDKLNPQIYDPLVSLHGGLKEYPNISFSYNHFKNLNNDIINLSILNSKIIDSIGSERTLYNIEDGTQVNLRIRSTDLEMVNQSHSFQKSNDIKINGKELSKTIRFYELAIADEIIVRTEKLAE